MKLSRLSVFELFTILLTGWTGFIYALLLLLRFSHQMLQHQTLQLVVFGPAVILLVWLAGYELHIHRRR